MRIPCLMTGLLRGLGFATTVLVVLFAAIQTGPGKRVLASLAGTLLSGGGLTVTFSDVEGFIPTDMSAGAVTLTDRQGEFARMERLRLVWHPLALLTATLEVETLEAAKLSLSRKPDLPPAPAAQSAGIGGALLPMRMAPRDRRDRHFRGGGGTGGDARLLCLGPHHGAGERPVGRLRARAPRCRGRC
jgi:autotransporter translocation and assembly factor TamB